MSYWSIGTERFLIFSDNKQKTNWDNNFYNFQFVSHLIGFFFKITYAVSNKNNTCNLYFWHHILYLVFVFLFTQWYHCRSLNTELIFWIGFIKIYRFNTSCHYCLETDFDVLKNHQNHLTSYCTRNSVGLPDL